MSERTKPTASSTDRDAGNPLVLAGVGTARGRFRGGPYDLSIEPGSALVLVGRNGCGKSTLLETIAGLLPVGAGTIRHGDRVWAGEGIDVPPHERGVGMLLQRLGLWPHRTVREQAALVAPGAGGRIASLAGALGLVELLDRRPSALSGGEAQRAALLRTLATDSPVLLLDEPTSDQHAEGEASVRTVVETELERGRIVAIASHRTWPGLPSVELG